MTLQQTFFWGDVCQVLICLGLLALASIYDIRTREIPDWTSLGLVVAGFSLAFFTGGIESIMALTLSTVLAFLFGFFMFKLGFWGGGDAKLMTGLVACLSRPVALTAVAAGNIYPGIPWPIPLSIVVNVLVTQVWYLLILANLGVYKACLKRNIVQHVKNRAKHVSGFFFSVVVVGAILWLIGGSIFAVVVTALFLGLLFGLFMSRRVLEETHWREADVTALTAGDCLKEELSDGGRSVKGYPHRLTEKEVTYLKEHYVRDASHVKVIMWQGVALAPAFLVSAILTLLLGDLLYFWLLLGFPALFA
ncbi:MAG: A24 family peptidase [Candidatus Ranarchaeia archaeon]